MNKTQLKSGIATDLESLMRTHLMDGTDAPYPKLTAFCNAVAESVANRTIDQITTNGVVKLTGTASGTVTGTTCSVPLSTVTGKVE